MDLGWKNAGWGLVCSGKKPTVRKIDGNTLVKLNKLWNPGKASVIVAPGDTTNLKLGFSLPNRQVPIGLVMQHKGVDVKVWTASRR